jgi:ABC-type multidrug transport system fused ATPase/permease subunit
MIASMPLPALLASVFQRLFTGIMESKDDRMDALKEMLSGMRTVKYFGWESKFVEKITATREEELRNNKKMYTQMSFAGIAWGIMPFVNMVVLLVAYTVFYGNTITASVLFTTLSLFEILSSSLSIIPWNFTMMMESVVALRRISTFLDEDEVERDTMVTKIDIKTRVSSAASSRSAAHPIIGFVGATYSWPSKKIKTAPAPAKPPNEGGWFQNLKSKFSKTPTPVDTPNPEPEVVIERFQLKNISADFPVGELSLIVGPTGSGKSALLLALLGELERIEGHMYLPRLDYNRNYSNDCGSGIAYVAQTAWLQNGTVRDNILFGKAFNQELYSAVIEGCALTTDLNVLEFGDLTEIGEQGIALSGGQKQRVSLARAIYSDTSVLLLDDCLSAVDTHTGRHIFQTLNGPLLEGRTILMATHQVQLTLSAARYVVVLNKGKVIGTGTPEECILHGWIDHVTLVAPTSDQSSEVDTLDGDKSTTTDMKDDKKAASRVKPKDEEKKAEGSVPLKVYKYYFFATGGWIAWPILVGIYALEQGTIVAERSWLAIWANKMAESTGSFIVETANAVTPKPIIASVMEAFTPKDRSAYGATTMTVSSPESNVGFYIGVFVLLGFIPMFISCLATFYASTVVGINGSRSIHAQLLYKVSRAKSHFFDTTPIGRIINRFSADMATVDDSLLEYLVQLVNSLILITFTVLVISVNMPIFVVPATLIVAVYIVLGVLYVPISRDLKRLNSISRSPILHHLNETVSGLATIRAYGFERRFQAKNMSNLDNNNRAYYWLWSASRWLGWRIDLTSALVSFCTGLLILQSWDRMESGWAALSLSYSMMFNWCIASMIRCYAQNEMNMNSLERIIEYMDIEEEAPAIIEGSRPPASWPHAGQISVENLTIRYSPGSLDVLKNVSLSIKCGEKVGVVGRTGSGKSTLAISLLRILEPTWGTIRIDDIDITKIGLQDLRSNLTIIPQDPVLFKGTLRFNLDPFGEHEDIEIWEALRRSHLIPAATTRNSGSSTPSSSAKNSQKASSTHDQETTTLTSEEAETTIDPTRITLDTEVQEGGSNFSQGQRQLVALARALVRRSKIIIMDEATASVDFETDLKIQKTIREEMADATVITIAHRIRTIADFDRVLVMQAGEVAEFDKPYILMRREGSLFRDLCEQSTELDTLLAISDAKERCTSA